LAASGKAPCYSCCRILGTPRRALEVAPVGQLSGRGFTLRPPYWPEVWSVLGVLRERCPPAMPVVVRTSRLPRNLLGDSARRKKRFVIRLNRQMMNDQAVETLLHEWAHALAWNFSLDRLSKMPGLDPVVFERASHDEAWGCAYSRVWRAYLEAGWEAA
jgi:hypothetical protein